MPDFLTIDDLDVEGSTVLVRSDLNVPVRNGAVTDRTRITRFAPTVRDLLDRGAAVVVMSHFGRPNGQPDPALSLQPIAVPLAEAVGAPVGFAADCVGEVATQAAAALSPGEALLLENVRFHPGEEANDPGFARKLAALGDVYVNDAFSAAHRAHASTEGIARWLPAAAGRLMQAELDALGRALDTPARPVCAVVGGAKVSSKLELLGNLVARVDKLLVGGGMANTFLAALGRDVGRSLCEHDLASAALEIERVSERKGCELLLPTDVVVAEALAPDAARQTVRVDTVPSDMMILDVGPETIGDFEDAIAASRTLVWNGPLGAFETPPFDAGTRAVSAAAAKRTAEGALLSVAGGGDTVAALSAAGTIRDFSYVSTAGGAFLEWLEGKELPGVAALKVAKSSAAKVSAAKAPGSASGSPSG